MAELTKQYFDKQLGNLATKEDIKNLDTKIETEVANLAGMMSRRFDELEKKLDVRAEVDQLKSQMSKVWQALNIKS